MWPAHHWSAPSAVTYCLANAGRQTPAVRDALAIDSSVLLLVAIAALLIGPALLQLGRFGPRLQGLLDGFSFISIAGLLGYGILPEALAAGGGPGVAFAIVGLIFPWALERLFERAAPRAHVAVLCLGIAGLAAHAMIDGLALVSGHEHATGGGPPALGEAIGLAVILHRFPVGLALWHLVAPHFGVRAALSVLLLLCGATALGFAVGPVWIAALDGTPLAWFQAFVAGSILHVIVYEPAHHGAPATFVARWPDRLGLLIGLALLYVYL
jgi:hypothetical protein